MRSAEFSYLLQAQGPDDEAGGILADKYYRIELDIGSGAGHFLECIAIANPYTLHIGVEIDSERHLRATLRLRQSRVRNAISINCEAYAFLKYRVSTASIDGAHVYFPNPYPEGDGQPSRLVGIAFINEIGRVLKPGGYLRLATDNSGYFEDIWHLLSAEIWWTVRWLPLAVESPSDGLRLGTPCEVKYLVRERRPIYYLQAMRL
jgi:tRNA (guanine-N7-)-methyltransferase